MYLPAHTPMKFIQQIKCNFYNCNVTIMTNCTGGGGETEHRVTGAGALITKEVTGDRKEVMEFRITRGN